MGRFQAILKDFRSAASGRQTMIEDPTLHDSGGLVVGLFYVTGESAEWGLPNAANTLSGNSGMDCTCTPMAS